MVIKDRYAVERWMNTKLVKIDEAMTIFNALHLLGESNQTELPVQEENCLIGVVRLKDCIDGISHGLAMTDPIKLVIDSSFNMFNENARMDEIMDIPAYIVEETGELVGQINELELIAYHQSMKADLYREKEFVKWFELCFDTAYEGLAVVDEHGVIQLFNDMYSRFVGVPKEEAIGQPADKIIDNTRLPVVLQTGIPERSQAHRLQGQNLVVHRLPIWKDNKVVGAVGILVYEGVSEIYDVIERMELLDDVVNRPINILNINRKQVRFEDILGESQKISETKKMARKAAHSHATVLITGDSGVGKEQFARAIHDMGVTNKGNFVSVNCSAIPDNLLESELFGYAKGAFTGAGVKGKIGKFELAHQGTLFLDEIGDMPMAMQVKILRALEEREIEKVGGTHPIPVNFRLITATNKDLKQMIKQGKFREDLYYRLYVVPIHIPPLRHRKEDIPKIIAHKMHQLAETYGLPEKTVDKQVLRLMHMYDWPGNIRELMNVLERLFVLTDGDHINVRDLPTSFFVSDQSKRKISIKKSSSQSSKGDEEQAIKEALRQVKGNKTQAAKLLGISRATLYNKISRLSLD